MNPAPTLLDEWITNQAFWAFLFLAAFAGVVYYGSEFVKRMHAAPEQPEPAPQPHQCQITGCHQPGTHVFELVAAITGRFYACAGHAVAVRDWAGPYDQELDQATDLGQWNQEMTQ